MKLLFRYLMITAMLTTCMALVSCSSDDDELSRTHEPRITYKVQGDYVTVTAVGKGNVKLYIYDSMEEIENPINFGRDYIDYSVSFAATAHESGKEVSERVVKNVVIPKTDEPKILTVFSAVENENDSTFFKFDFNLYKNSGTIGVYKALFGSYKTNFTFDVPVTFDKASGIYRCNGTDFTTEFSPDYDNAFDGSTVDNLNCEVNIKSQTYNISFDCHGKHFDYSGGFSKIHPVHTDVTDVTHFVIII